MDTKFTIVLDEPNYVYTIPKAYDDTQLDLYMVLKRISGKQIYDIYLNNSKEYGIQRPVPKNDKYYIQDDPQIYYDILIVWDDLYMYAIDIVAEKHLGEVIFHGLKEPPCIMLKNFVNPGCSEGISDVAHIIGINHYLNALLTNIADIVDYQANPIGVATKVPQDLDVGKMIADNGIIQFEDEKSKFEFIKHPGTSNEAQALYEMVSDFSEEQTSMSKLASAGQSGTRKIDSGPAVSSLNIGVEAMLNLKKQLMSTGLSKFFSLYLKNVDSIYRPELYGDAATIQVGSPNTDSSFRYNSDDINGEYNVEVLFTEGVFDMPTKIQSALQMQQAGLISKKTARQMCNIKLGEDEDKLIALEQEQDIQYQARMTAAQNGEIQGEPLPEQMQTEQGLGGPIMDQLSQMTNQPAMSTQMPNEAGGMPPEMANIPPELQGQNAAPQEQLGAEVPISPEMMSPAAGMNEEEIIAKLDSIPNLKGEAIFVGIQGDKIIIALEDMSDKKTIIDAMPEYKGQLEFINLTENM